MKYLLTLLFLILINQVYAQKYQPLVEEGKYWIYGHYDFSNCFLMGQRLYEIRYFDGDTIILDRQYKKLISANSQILNSQYAIFEKKNLCYMREDTLQQKVFMINNDYDLFPCVDSLEICIWDFKLQVGDTTTQCVTDMFLRGGLEGLTNCIIDSVLTNQSGKILYTKGVIPGTCGDLFVSPVYYLEGHGMDIGPMYRKFNVLYVNYCEGTLADCNIISSTKDEAKDAIDIKIYPNPATEFISFYLDQNSIQKVNQYNIIDITGQIIKGMRPITSDINYVIHTHDFPSGIYFIQFLNEGKIIQTQKLIISH